MDDLQLNEGFELFELMHERPSFGIMADSALSCGG